jgi:hypothetical protein
MRRDRSEANAKMEPRRSRRFGFALVAALAVAVGAPGAAMADESTTPGVGWELSAANYPSALLPGIDAEDLVTVSPEASGFKLTYESESTASLPAGASAGAVQSALEALPSVGVDDVQVTHGGTTLSYVVKFVEALGATTVPELEGEGAAVSVKTEGEASGTIGVDVFNVGAANSHGTTVFTDRCRLGFEPSVPVSWKGSRRAHPGAIGVSTRGSRANCGAVPEMGPGRNTGLRAQPSSPAKRGCSWVAAVRHRWNIQTSPSRRLGLPWKRPVNRQGS